MKPSHRILLGIGSIAVVACAAYLRLHPEENSKPIASQTPHTPALAPAEKTAAPAIAPAPAAVAEIPGDAVKRIAQHLGSPDAAERDAAKAALAALPPDQRAWLKFAADDALDNEVRGLLLARLREINEVLELAPLPVSLHMNDASLTEIMPQLASQMQSRVSASKYGTSNELHYTLDRDKAPFWEVIQGLNAQHPLMPMTTTDFLGEFQFANATQGMGTSAIDGPFICFTSVRVGQAAALPIRGTRGNTTAPALTIGITIAADPRLMILESETHYEPAKDELGNIVSTEPAPTMAEGGLLLRRLLNGPRASISAPITPSETIGTRIPSLIVTGQFLVGLAGEEADLDDVANKLNQPLKLGTTTVTITRFSLDRQILIYPRSTSSERRGDPQTPRTYVQCEIYDKDNKLLRRWTHDNDRGAGMLPGGGGPFRLHLNAPQKIKVVELRFELKDVPIPK